MRLHEDTVRAVRERAQIVDQFTPGALKRIGSEFVARCPWHDDQRPSLTVSPRTNRAFCFVCARGVDSIGWVQESEGLSFSEAIIHLAQRYGIEAKAANEADAQVLAAEQAERNGLLQRRKAQVRQYTEALWQSPALAYLMDQRGLTAETIETWQIGYGEPLEGPRGTKVAVPRVMIPLNDPQGRTIAFTGRALADGYKPKYRNSPNDLLYSKADLVFGLDKARPEIVRSGQVVIVEGQFDVICCWQAGIQNMVAVSGSSLTGGMIERLASTTRLRKVTLVFDGDLGGELAASRALESLREVVLRGELELQILTLPAGQDPADLAASMAERIAAAPHWVEWWFDRVTRAVDLADPHSIAKAEAGVREILKVLPTGGLREFVRRRAKEVLQAVPSVPPARVETSAALDRCRWAERRALRLYLLDEGCRPVLSEVAYRDPTHRQAWELIRTIEAMGAKPERVATVFAEVILLAPEDLLDVCRPLVRPIPEVLRVIQQNPVGELEGALACMAQFCCQDANSDQAAGNL